MAKRKAGATAGKNITPQGAQKKLKITPRTLETWQVAAFEQGATVEDALRFKTLMQLEALKLGATPEEALKFTGFPLQALRAGAPVEEALAIGGGPIEQAGAPVEEVTPVEQAKEDTEFQNDHQVTPLETDDPVEMQGGCADLNDALPG